MEQAERIVSDNLSERTEYISRYRDNKEHDSNNYLG
jgi:hypothetical protein